MKRFWEKAELVESGCWEWRAAINSHTGYGCFKLDGYKIDSHRCAMLLIYDDIFPFELYICHTCDNRKCINPEHLFFGTQSDNMKDAYDKGRLLIDYYPRPKPQIIHGTYNTYKKHKCRCDECKQTYSLIRHERYVLTGI